MTKNFGQLSLILISVLCLGIILGMFVARFSGRTSVQLSVHNQPYTTASATSETAQTEAIGKLNINLANAEQLAMLPGIGEGLAQRIIAYRQENGPFANIDDLTKVSGIGKKRIESLAEYITVGG